MSDALRKAPPPLGQLTLATLGRLQGVGGHWLIQNDMEMEGPGNPQINTLIFCCRAISPENDGAKGIADKKRKTKKQAGKLWALKY